MNKQTSDKNIPTCWWADLKSLTATLCCAVIGGLFFKYIGIPAPYMLGSMLGVWTVTALVKSARPYMRVPRWFHIIIVLGVGVIVGAMFGPDTLDNMLDWIYTVSAMLVSSIIATSVGYWYLTRRRNYEPSLALFCALPGGQAEVILISREYVEKDYVVALCHLVRVVVIFCSVPLALAFLLGESAVRDSNQALSDLPGLMDVPIMLLAQFVALALVGYALARLLRMPVPFLLGPMLLSMSLHLADIINIPRINEVVFLAQITIGGMVGARLGQVKFRILAGYLRDALVNVVLVLSVFVSSAYLIATWVELNILDVMLAFVPGGLYEITLLSLVFGFDVAFVAIHHSTRVLLLMLALPLLVRLLPANETKVPR